MALGAGASTFATKDRSPVVRSAVVATEAAASAPLAGRKMFFHKDFAWRGQRLIILSFNRMACLTLSARIGDMCAMSKRCSVGSAFVLI